jgi:hypothetical protein
MDDIKAMDDDEARAREELRDFEDRKPSPYPKLLMWTPTHGQNAKIIPSHVSLPAMIADYFEFARNHPMPASVHEQDLDRRVLPRTRSAFPARRPKTKRTAAFRSTRTGGWRQS